MGTGQGLFECEKVRFPVVNQQNLLGCMFHHGLNTPEGPAPRVSAGGIMGAVRPVILRFIMIDILTRELELKMEKRRG
ncbi:hypothetical protein DSLASN_22320 [Desulfoluna limicola]|uniref:Uncharacterized protein n=1 Tax=Desulfoluna limicola TaxID=2810562 RepID=A0ABM7PG98_9BACT|nr:hypothetical protein DSLASN_22320 [Desulfoluna limicola]